MNDQDQIIKELKSELYDAGKQLQSMNAVLSAIIEKLGLANEEGLDVDTILERAEYLAGLEPSEEEKKTKKSK